MRNVCPMIVLLKVNSEGRMIAARVPARRMLLISETSRVAIVAIKVSAWMPAPGGLRVRILLHWESMALEAQPSPLLLARASRMTIRMTTSRRPSRKTVAVDSADFPSDGVASGLRFGNAATTTRTRSTAKANPLYYSGFSQPVFSSATLVGCIL